MACLNYVNYIIQNIVGINMEDLEILELIKMNQDDIIRNNKLLLEISRLLKKQMDDDRKNFHKLEKYVEGLKKCF